MSGGSRRSGACLRCCLVVLAVTMALYVSGPALYWRFKKGIKLGDNGPSCSPCICDCPPPLSLLTIAPGIVSLDVLVLFFIVVLLLVRFVIVVFGFWGFVCSSLRIRVKFMGTHFRFLVGIWQ